MRRCQADRCTADLSEEKQFHRKHKVLCLSLASTKGFASNAAKKGGVRMDVHDQAV